jgi:hypothetical protein
VILVGSFLLEVLVSLRAAMLLRALVIAAVLVGGAGLSRPPSAPGWNRWLIWTAGWMLPLGYVVAAAFPYQSKAGLHVAFIGGFATLALGVASQVALGHLGYRSVMVGRPWQVPAIGTLMAVAILARSAMEFDAARYFHWMGVASVSFLTATLVWLQLIVPKMIARAPAGS